MQEPYKSVWTELLDTPFRQAWIDAGGLKTRFVQAGDPGNPPLVLLHGTAGSLENFAANFAAHARHFNCIAFDMIGSGMTDKPDFDYETDHYVKHAVDFFNAMGIKKASVIGLSLGARVASRLAIDYPDKVEKLILLSATAYFPAKPIQDDIKRSRSAAAAKSDAWDSIVEIFKGLFHGTGQSVGRPHRYASLDLSPRRHEGGYVTHSGAARSGCLQPQPNTRRRLEALARPDVDHRRGRSQGRFPWQTAQHHRQEIDPERKGYRNEALQPMAANGGP